MNSSELAYTLRDHISDGTSDYETGEIWFDIGSPFGAPLVTSAERGHFEVAATLSDGRLVLNPLLTDLLTEKCPTWSDIFNLRAGRLVLLDARLMLPGGIEAHDWAREVLEVAA